jgi:hypothetical protein
VIDVVIFINGELLNFTLNNPILPGELMEINYNARQAGEDLEIKLIYNYGKTVQAVSPASMNTNSSGFTNNSLPLNEIGENQEPDYSFFNCIDNDINNTWFSGAINGSNGACCGDDGALDTFFNGSISSTSTFCQNGTYVNADIDNNQTVCEYYGYNWFFYELYNQTWSFEEGSGTTTTSNNGISGTFSKSSNTDGTIIIPQWTTGYSGGGLYFQNEVMYGYSAGGRVVVGNVAQINMTQEVTLSAWIYPQTFGTYPDMNVIAGREKAYTMRIYKSTGQFYVYSIDEEGDVTTCQAQAGIIDEEWRYVTMVVRPYTDGWTIRGYVNGSLICEDTNTLFNGPRDDSESFRIGEEKDWWGLSYSVGNFEGKIDELMLTNISLSSIEINNLYKGYLVACCGDDGDLDNFSNSTHQCVNGVFSVI